MLLGLLTMLAAWAAALLCPSGLFSLWEQRMRLPQRAVRVYSMIYVSFILLILFTGPIAMTFQNWIMD